MDPEADAARAWYDHKSALMAKTPGAEHDMVMLALIPYEIGGGLDLHYYPNGYLSYELVMFTKHRLDLDVADDVGTPFGKAHTSIGDEVTIFYGWVSHNEPSRDPCCCGAPECRGFVNFDLSDDDVANVEIVDGRIQSTDGAFRQRLAEYGSFLESIGQEHVRGVIASALARRKAVLAKLPPELARKSRKRSPCGSAWTGIQE